MIRNAAGEDRTANFTNVKKTDGKLTVTPRALTVATGSASKPYDGTPLGSNDASVEGLANGEIVGIETTGSITEKGSTENTYEITWAAEGNEYTAKEGNYTVTDNLGTLTVTDSSVEVTLTAASASKTYDGTALTADSVTAEGLPEGFTVEATASGSQTDAGSGKNVVNDGFIIKNAVGEDRTANFSRIEKIDGTLTVNPKAVTISTGSDSKAYDGKALNGAGAVIEGLAAGETYALSASGTITEVGSTENGYEMTWAGDGNSFTAKESNYTVTENLGTLTVTTNGAAIVLRAASGSKDYDGTALTVDDVTAEGLPDGFTLEAGTSGSQLNAGESANTVRSGYAIKNADGQNRTSSFTNVSTVDGKLTVNPRKVTITTGSGSKQYDGKALTVNEARIDGLAPSEVATISATGSQTEVGSSDNTYSITWVYGANKNNYAIEEQLGKLTVSENTSEITLTAASGNKTYDGEALTAEGVTADGLPGGFTVSASASGSQTDAGSSANTVNDGYAIKNSAGEDKTAYFTNVKKADGTLTVEKRSVKLASASGEKVYDGIALMNASITEGGDGFADGEGAVYNVTGSQKDAGESANAFTYALTAGTNADNYTISSEEGTLKVTPVSDKVTVTVTEHSGSEKYDGSAKTVSGYDVSIDNDLYTSAGFTFSGNDSVSGTDAGSYPMEIKAEDFTNTNGNFSDVGFAVQDGSLEITKRSVTLTSGSDETVYSGAALINHMVDVTGDGFADGEGASYAFTGSQKTVGSSENAFTYTLIDGTNEENYIIEAAFGTLTIISMPVNAKYEVTVTAASANEKYDGREHSVSGFDDGTESGGSIPVTAGGHSYRVSGLSASASGTDAGSYPVNITGTAEVTDEDGNDVTDQFVVNRVPGSLDISKRSITMTSGSAKEKYNGRPLTNGKVDVTGDGFADGEGAEYTVTGSQTLVGMSNNTFTYKLNEGVNENNYDISKVYGQLTVTSRESKYGITLRPLSATELYDGSEKSVSGFESLSFMVDGNAYTVSGVEAEASGTKAGTYPVNVSGTAAVLDSKGNDVSGEFEVTTESGALTIYKRSVVMTSASGSKQYDGTPLRNGSVTVTGNGFAEGEGASYSVTGSRLLPGSSGNTFTYSLNDGTSKGNYDISTSFGTLTVLNRDAKYEITVKAVDAAELYDGSEKSAEGFETLEFKVGGNNYTVEGLTARVSATDAGRYTSVISGTPVVKDASGNDVSSEFAVSTEPGELVISPRKVTLTSGSASHAYNGKALTNNNEDVSGDGFAEGEGATYNVTGSRTTVGVSRNTFDYTLNEGTFAKNYEITKVLGTLNVTNRDAKYRLTLTPAGGSAVYDGEEHGVSGFESTTAVIEEETYEVSGLTVEASGTDAGSYGVNVSGTAVVRDAEGNDVTDQFSVEISSAALTITPREVLLRSADESFEYDGSAHNGSGRIEIEGVGFVGTDGVTVTPTASRTLVGSVANSFDWSFNDGTKAGNYDVKTAYGILSITSRDATYEIVMKANSDTAEYDGQEHSVSGFEKNEFEVEGNDYTVENVEASARGTEAGVYTTEIFGTAEVKDAEGNDVSDQFAVSYESGSLTITKAPEATAAPADGGTTPDGGGNGGNGTGGGADNGGTGGNGLTIETIPDTIPVASAPSGYWALLNLIMTVISALGAVYMILRRNRDDEDEQPERRRKRVLSVLAAIVLAIASIVVFIITEDMTNTMALFDRYTLLMAALLIGTIAAIITGNKDSKESEETEA